MPATILDGKALAAQLRERIRSDAASFLATAGRPVGIAVVQMGDDPASDRYVAQIARSFEKAGMRARIVRPDVNSSTAEVVDQIRALNADEAMDGIIVQLPLPKHISQEQVTAAIAPGKDVDGVNPINAGLLSAGAGQYFAPATPSGGMELLRSAGVDLKGKKAVVIGRSNIVGKPMAMLLLHQHATVTICHSRTIDLAAEARQADVLVAAIGKPNFITADMIKPGAIVIDFGVNVTDQGMVGDVEFAGAQSVAGAITPVPGGTGPLTNVVLMRNTITAANRAAARRGG